MTKKITLFKKNLFKKNLFKKNLILVLAIALLATTFASSSDFVDASTTINDPGWVIGPKWDLSNYTSHSISDMPGQPVNIKAVTYTWHSLSGTQLTLQLPVDVNVYTYLTAIPRERVISKWAQTYICEAYSEQLATALAMYFINLRDSMGWDDYQLAQEVANFVQKAVIYEYDTVAKGASDYPKYAYETFVDGKGDCEDQAMLMAAIYRKLNYGTALILLPSHMAVGLVCGDKGSGYCTEKDGRYYFYVEPTASRPFGDCSDKYKTVGWQLYVVN